MHSAYQRTAFAKVRNLPEKLVEISSAFVVNIGFRNEAQAKAGFLHTDTPLDIFRKPIKAKPACFLKHFFPDSHVKASGLKAFGCRSSNSACREWGRHGVGHRALHR